jgi:metallophosphoesterase (TIGR00282 family)
LLHHGVDVITSGNHIWHKSDIIPLLEREPRLLRPANYPPSAPGSGYGFYVASDGSRICVANLLGRALMDSVDDPFRGIDAILEEADRKGVTIRLIDFHAEATSEKIAFALHVDGRASAVVGTHTHVQTADERILPKGTGFITDLGMTGPESSIIGMQSASVIQRFLTQQPQRFEVADGSCAVNGAVIDISRETGRTTAIARVSIRDIASNDCE